MAQPEMVLDLDDEQKKQFIELGIPLTRIRQTQKNGSITLFMRKLTRAEKDAQALANPRNMGGRDTSWPLTSRS